MSEWYETEGSRVITFYGKNGKTVGEGNLDQLTNFRSFNFSAVPLFPSQITSKLEPVQWPSGELVFIVQFSMQKIYTVLGQKYGADGNLIGIWSIFGGPEMLDAEDTGTWGAPST